MLLINVTGLLLLALRETAAMGLLLVVHLGCVLALFLSLPYGKFVHGIYRVAALVKHASEHERPGSGLWAQGSGPESRVQSPKPEARWRPL